jgi:hypothetical protein
VLKGQVFRSINSINGYSWFLRMRGYEVDQVVFDRKSFGQQYALKRPTNDPEELSRILMKLCEKLGRRLRRTGHAAQGIHVACAYRDSSHWHQGKQVGGELFATLELYRKAQLLLNGRAGKDQIITHLGVSCYGFVPSNRARKGSHGSAGSRAWCSTASPTRTSVTWKTCTPPRLHPPPNPIALEGVTLTEALQRRFGVELPLPQIPNNYNAAKTQQLPVVLSGEERPRHVELMRWDLIPRWQKPGTKEFNTINARAETVAIKPTFRHLIARHRCLVPASGFYE